MARANRASIELAAKDSTGAAFSSVAGKFRGLQGNIDGLASRFAGLQGTIAATISGFGVGALVTSIADGLDAFNDLSDATGASIENISRLETAARRTGGSFDDVAAALLKFNQALNSAKAGSDQAAVFEALGLSVEELRRQDPADALLVTARAFQKFGQDGENARAQALLLGRSVGELAPLLKDLAENSTEFGSVTREQAEAAEVFNKALARVSAETQNLGRVAVGELLPVLNEVLAAFEKAGKNADGLNNSGGLLRIGLEALVVAGANVAFVFGGVGREIGAIAAQAVALGRLDVQGFKAISEAVKADAERARAELDAFEQRVFRAGKLPQATYSNEGRGGKSTLPGLKVAGGAKGGVREQASEFEKYIQRLGDAQIATLQLSAVEQARIDIVSGKLGKLTGTQEEEVLSLARGLDALRAVPKVADAATLAALKAREDQAKAVEALIASSTGARFDALVDTAEALIESFNSGTISATDYARGIEVLGLQFKALEPAAQQAMEKASTFADEASRNIQDTLGNTLTSVLKGDFDSIGDLWADLMIRMVAQAAAAQLNQYLFGGALGGVGGAAGGLLGGFVGDLFGGFRAAGGPVQPGRAYVVGERGPEMIVPSSAGTVIPNGGMGGVSITYGSINIGEGVSRAEVYSAIERANRNAEARMRQVLARNQLPVA